MPYIAILALSTIFSAFFIARIFRIRKQKKSGRLRDLEFECVGLNKEKLRMMEENSRLKDATDETIALYNLTKNICGPLDQEKVFAVFKESVSDYLGAQDCRLLAKETDLSIYGAFTILPLIIQKDIAGYLAIRGISGNDAEKFQILAQQFLVGFKRALLYKKMQELSITDSLTRLFSRRHFLERFAEELRRSGKFKYNFSCLMIDIDKFKDFNDKYGHLVGDAILREVAGAIKEAIRQIDFVGRYGGEEFSVILVETGKQEARFAAERLRVAVESKNIKVYDEELKVTVSIGIATFPDDGITLEAAIEGADKALYQAKAAGRNRVKYLS
ncbi:MAG: GGDEF domain-containing protein [Candidatus Omnitrophota bacterium]